MAEAVAKPADSALPVRELEGETVAAVATPEPAKTEEAEKHGDDTGSGSGNDNASQYPPRLYAAGFIEEHILPRLSNAFVDYFVTEVVAKLPTQFVTMEEIRAHPDRFRARIAVDSSPGTGAFPRVADYTLASETDHALFAVRVYHPDPAEHGTGPYPVHLNFHGGGFVLGDLQNEAQLCLSMREAGVVVVDVNYRHCPETIWGKCFEDAWAALIWVRASADALNIRPDSVSLGGISAGGHITLVLQQRARDEGVPLRLVMPTVPPAAESLFYRYYVDSPYPSFHEFVRAPILPWTRIQFFAMQCLASVADEAGTDDNDDLETVRAKRLAALERRWPQQRHLFAPIRTPNWAGLCEAFVRTAEIDMLRDEGEAYAQKLVEAGTRVTVKRYLGAVHTFMALDFLPQKRAFDADSIVALRQAHGLAPLAAHEVEARVTRVLDAVRTQQEKEKAAKETKGEEVK
ncbi:Alpha/beta hydrolase fold-3 [Niveomyces insectorum RCEF 264]|uniref:Alpha/beta hydrolase fold-3 n=1 Tax=Niveomyces insectorum RCEF 264 TaxID=1081102 RepID=A0A167Y457_9HYPO|nr:Alpha/beta hydrolase fold-3 [Niveomyces insectorum RCEF 264]